MSVGPPLNGVGRRRTPDWVKEHFADPKKLSPGSIMPAYKFTPAELESLTTYLFALPSDSEIGARRHVLTLLWTALYHIVFLVLLRNIIRTPLEDSQLRADI